MLLFVSSFLCLSAQEEAKSIEAKSTETKTISSKLTEATVFLVGAELTHTATATLVKGDNEFRIEKLSPTIDRNSIKIKANNSVVISAFEFSTIDLPTKKPNEGRIKQLTDSIGLINNQLDELKLEMKIDTDLKNLLKTGVDNNIEDTIQISDLIKVMEYYQTKSTEIGTRQLSNGNKQKDLEKQISELKRLLTKEIEEEYEKTGVLLIRCTTPLASTASFTVSYYTHLAKWTPFYDINVESTEKPIKIVSKAKVSQHTTVDWNNVKLSLSTNIPNNNKEAPLFRTWLLQYARVKDSNIASFNEMVVSPIMAQNAYSYSEESSRTRSSVSDKKSSNKSSALKSIYMVDGIPMDDISEIPADMIKSMDIQGNVVVVTTKDISDYVISEENMLSQTFNIDLPYTIPGSGKEQSIELQTQHITAEYQYYCAPKLSAETFLLAEIPNWETLNLMSGKASITYDGTYIGETQINASSTHEKLSLTLGADKRIAVKRELMKDFSSSRTFGNNLKKVYAYKLTVKNNRTIPVRFVLKEQYPQSTNKEIEAVWLKAETTTPTFVKEDVGVITWEEELAAGVTKEYKFSYSIQYPKARVVE